MVDIKLKVNCVACQGVGIRYYNATPNGPLLEENPCSQCGGTGFMAGQFTINDSWFDAVTAELDYLHGKVTAIWNQVKPGN